MGACKMSEIGLVDRLTKLTSKVGVDTRLPAVSRTLLTYTLAYSAKITTSK